VTFEMHFPDPNNAEAVADQKTDINDPAGQSRSQQAGRLPRARRRPIKRLGRFYATSPAVPDFGRTPRADVMEIRADVRPPLGQMQLLHDFCD
jgi:hypothetical protein